MKHCLQILAALMLALTVVGCGASDPADQLEEMTRIMQNMTETMRPAETGTDVDDISEELTTQAKQLEKIARQLEAQLNSLDNEARTEFNEHMEKSDYPSVAMSFMMELMRIGMIPGAADKLSDVLQRMEQANPAKLN